ALDSSSVIQGLLPRRTAFSRRAAQDSGSDAAREQVVAANVDVVFIAVALGQDLDRLLLERYVALALQSGAQPVILLTKADLEPDLERVVEDLGEVGGEIPIQTVSVRTGLGLANVRARLGRGVTGGGPGAAGGGQGTAGTQ